MAACPSGADLADKALRLSGAGVSQTYRAGADGIVDVQTWNSDSSDWEAHAIYGVYPVDGSDSYPVGNTGVSGSTSVYSLSVGRDALPVPAPGGHAEIEVEERLLYEGAPEGGVKQPGFHLSMRFGDPSTLTIAGCRYHAVPVTIIRDKDALGALGAYYLPDFGFALSGDFVNNSGMPVFDWVKTIEVVP